MPTDRTTITLSDLVRRATMIVDADGADEAVTSFATRYEDDDIPVRGILDGLEERLAFGADEDAPVVMAQALGLIHWNATAPRKPSGGRSSASTSIGPLRAILIASQTR